MEQIKILIADENPKTRKCCREALMRAGIRTVDEAANGEDALGYINRNHPDVVIADVWLSRLDGIGLIRQALSLGYGQDKPPAFIIASMVTNQNIFVEAGESELVLASGLEEGTYNIEVVNETGFISGSKVDFVALTITGKLVENSFDYSACQLRCLHKSATCTAFDYFRCRTSHIDIDYVRIHF